MDGARRAALEFKIACPLIQRGIARLQGRDIVLEFRGTLKFWRRRRGLVRVCLQIRRIARLNGSRPIEIGAILLFEARRGFGTKIRLHLLQTGFNLRQFLFSLFAQRVVGCQPCELLKQGSSFLAQRRLQCQQARVRSDDLIGRRVERGVYRGRISALK